MRNAQAPALGLTWRDVKIRLRLIFGVFLVLCIGCLAFNIRDFRRRAEWDKTVRAVQKLPYSRILDAARAFDRDHHPFDQQVALRHLVARGYIGADEIRGLEKYDVFVAIPANESAPYDVFVWVRFSSGVHVTFLRNGYIDTLGPM